jgi:hypothetical protein
MTVGSNRHSIENLLEGQGMHRAVCLAVLSCRIVFTAAAMLGLAVPCALAQMQIPNPLIRPHGLTNPAEPDAARADRAGRPAATPMPAAPIAFGAPAATEDPYARSVSELKERFANFYVSAIVGKQAMLRRSAATRAGTQVQQTQPVGTSMAPLPMGGAAVTAASRNDALMLADGELVASVGTTGALVAKVTSNEVTIYHVQEVMALPGGKLGGIRTVVFTGTVESSGSSGVPAIVLERPDPAYKRMITVEPRSRGAAGGQQDASGNGINGSVNNGGGGVPAFNGAGQ